MLSVWQISRTDSPFDRNIFAVFISSVLNARRRPPVRPRARAAANPALVRSQIRCRSNSANPAAIVKNNRPDAVDVSKPSITLLKFAPAACISSMQSSKCRVDRPMRSSRQTVSVSPDRNDAIARSNSGRSVLAPLAISKKRRSQSVSASRCKISVWS